MKTYLPSMAGLLLLSASAFGGQAFSRDPHIGYAYPAGGQQGTTFEMVIGGQHIKGVEQILVTGDGLRFQIGEYHKPLTKGQFGQLASKLRDLRKKKQEAIKKGTEDKKPLQEFKELAAKLGLKDFEVADFMQMRKELFDPKKQLNPQIEETVKVKVTIAPDAQPGRRSMRVQTPTGFSNPIFIDVGQYPEYAEKEPNTKTPNSGIGELPVVINGQIMPGDVDAFRFKARKGMRLVASVMARELTPYLADAVPGWFQAVLALKDADGKEVAFVDDFRFHPDPVLYLEVPKDGEYVLEIRDAIYRGREDFIYRITLGEVPYVTGVFPLGGRSGQKTTVELAGWNLPVQKLTLDARKKNGGHLPVSVRKRKKASNSVPFQLDTLPECVELEPNDQPFGAQRVEFPVIANGRINKPDDWDIYRFQGRAGTEIVAEVFARRLESPLDSVLKLTDSDGKLLAVNDDFVDKGAGWTTHHADSRVQAKLPADGTYLLHVGDTQRKGGPAYAYRVRIGQAQPDFRLRVVPSRINAKTGTVTPITVYALREHGFEGDINVKLQEVLPGFTLEGGWVPAGCEKVRMTLSVPGKPSKDPFELNLIGSAQVDGKTVTRRAVPAEDMMQAFIYHHLVAMDKWMVEVSPGKRKHNVVLKVQDPPVKLVAGDTAAVLVKTPYNPTKNPMMKQLRFALHEPPEGFAVKKTDLTPQGIRLSVATDGAKTKPGAKGNLIAQISMEFTPKTKDGKKRPKRVIPVGFLPAIPYEVVAK